MDSQGEAVKSAIIKTSSEKIPLRILPTLALQQGGIRLVDRGTDLATIPIPTDLEKGEKTGVFGKLISPDEAAFTFEVGDNISDILGLSQLVSELRNKLFDAGALGELIQKFRDGTTINLPVQTPFLQVTLGDYPSILNRLVKTQAKIELALEVVGNDDKSLGIQLNAWKKILDDIGRNLSNKQDDDGKPNKFDDLVVNAKQTLISKEGVKESYAEKLKRMLMQGDTIDHIKEKLGNLQDEKNITGKTRLENRLKTTLIYLQSIQKEGGISENEYSRVMYDLGIEEDILDKLNRLAKDEIVLSSAAVSEEKTESIKRLSEEWVKELESLFQPKSQDELISLYQKAYKVECYYRLQFHSGLHRSADLTGLLSEEFLRTTFSLNELRVLNLVNHSLQKEQGKDLFGFKEEITNIKDRAKYIQNEGLAEEKTRLKLVDLDKQIAEVIAPIVNIISDSLPHVNDNSATFLSALLADGDAVCAGKVNALIPVLRFLGLSARGVDIHRNIRGVAHAVAEADLFAQKIILDANYPKSAHVQEDDALEQKFRANEAAILNAYKVYAYFISPKKMAESDGKFFRINSVSGEKEEWYASIPYPHPFLAPDLDNQIIPGGVISNYLDLLAQHNIDVRTYVSLLTKCLEISPHNPGVSLLLGDFYVRCGKKDYAESIYKKILLLDPEYDLAHYFYGLFCYRQRDELLKTPEGRAKLREGIGYLNNCIRFTKKENHELINAAEELISRLENSLNEQP